MDRPIRTLMHDLLVAPVLRLLDRVSGRHVPVPRKKRTA